MRSASAEGLGWALTGLVLTGHLGLSTQDGDLQIKTSDLDPATLRTQWCLSRA